MLYFINLENINPIASRIIFNEMHDNAGLRLGRIAITGTYPFIKVFLHLNNYE